jgi:PAS domain S-box-containing protein
MTEDRGPETQNPRILVVEDENIVAMDIERGLKRLGYLISGPVGRGEEALVEIRKRRPDLVLMDVQLKGAMDGIETAQRILDEFDIPVIFLTAFADEQTLRRVKATEPFGYLLKPFEEKELHSAIEVTLHKHRLVGHRQAASEEALARSEERFRIFVESVRNYALFMLDPDGKITSWNSGAARIFGYPAEEAVGKHYSTFYPPGGDAHAVGALGEASQAGRHEEEGIRVRKDLLEFWSRTTITPLQSPSGALRGFGIIVCDITESRDAAMALQDKVAQLLQTEARLKEEVRAREDFLSIVSHELKTPLTPLNIQIQTLSRLCGRDLQGRLTIEKLRDSLKGCSSQIGHLNSLIEDLLDFSRITAGKLSVSKTDFDLSELARELTTRFDLQLSAVGRRIEVQASEEVHGCGDRFRIEQVVVNLLTNAIKYGGQKPIRLKVWSEPGVAMLSVEDQGLGIREEDQQRIFDRFERAVPVSNFGGLGLGLYIARQIIEAHDGKIRLKSLPGEGATFTLELPLSASARAALGNDPNP